MAFQVNADIHLGKQLLKMVNVSQLVFLIDAISQRHIKPQKTDLNHFLI